MNLKQPKNLNLFTMHFPSSAIVSILHRMSGVLLFLFMPLVTILFCYSFESYATFNHIIELLNSWPLFTLRVVLIWGIIHHLIAGCRHLLLDMLIGNDFIVARFTSKTVLLLSFVLTILVFFI